MKSLKIVSFVLMFFVFGCSGESADKENIDSYYEAESFAGSAVDEGTYTREELAKTDVMTADQTTAPSVDGTVSSVVEPEVIEPKIIKTANMNMEVENYAKAKVLIDSIVKHYQGFIANEDENRYASQISNQIVIRVPKENFEVLIEAISGTAKEVFSKSISMQDVTEEYVDIQTRLNTKKEVESRYIDLLKEARNVGDILEVEEHIRVLREEIEAKEGRLKFLDNRISLSTMNLSVYEQLETTTTGFGSELWNGLENGWEGLLIFIIGFLTMWPFWIIIGLIVFFIIRWNRKRKARRQNVA